MKCHRHLRWYKLFEEKCHCFPLFNYLLSYKVELWFTRKFRAILIFWFDLYIWYYMLKCDSLLNICNIKNIYQEEEVREQVGVDCTGWPHFWESMHIFNLNIESSLFLTDFVHIRRIAPVYFEWCHIATHSFCLLTPWTWQASLGLTQVPSATSERCHLIELRLRNPASSQMLYCFFVDSTTMYSVLADILMHLKNQ